MVMLIDWFTVIAQIINFIVLVWLLKRFLFKPVLKAVEERQTKVSQQISEAEDQMKSVAQQHGSPRKAGKEIRCRKTGFMG